MARPEASATGEKRALSGNAVGNEYALVFASDENHALGLAVAVHSALTNLASGVCPEVYVLTNDLSKHSRDRLRKVVASAGSEEPFWIQVPMKRVAHLEVVLHATQTTYARLLIPELLPRRIRRAVYLDTDVLVRRDLSPLFSIELGDAPVGAVRDAVIRSRDDGRSGVREPDPPKPYFNAGVLVMDVARWRTVGLGERAMQYAAAGSDPPRFADQDAMNAVIESWRELDYRWNVQLQCESLFGTGHVRRGLEQRPYRERWELFRAGWILHFMGPTKPWHHWCTTVGAASWLHAMLRTGWYAPREALIWLLHRQSARLRYRLGTTRRRSRVIARS